MIHNTLALISCSISSFSISYAYSRIPVPSSSFISWISCAVSSARNASTRSALSLSMAKCRGQTLGLLLTCSRRACSMPSITSPFSILLKQGWLQESLKSVCTAIFSPMESCLFLTTTSPSSQFSPCSSASSFCWMVGSALTAVEMQFLIALSLPIPFSLLHESHFALLTNSYSAGFGVLQSPAVACLQRPQSCSFASSETDCLLEDNALAASSNSWKSSCSGTSTACSVSSLVAGFSSCFPKSLLNEFLIKFILCNTTMIPYIGNSILQATADEQSAIREQTSQGLSFLLRKRTEGKQVLQMQD